MPPLLIVRNPIRSKMIQETIGDCIVTHKHKVMTAKKNFMNGFIYLNFDV